MHTDYSISLKFSQKMDTTQISKLLKRGSELGLIYFDQIEGERYLDSPILNSSKAAEKIVTGTKTFGNIAHSIFTKIYDTYFYLSFYSNEKENLSMFNEISIESISYPWKKEFLEGVANFSFDLARYTRLLLKLCEDFTIVEIKTTTIED